MDNLPMENKDDTLKFCPSLSKKEEVIKQSTMIDFTEQINNLIPTAGTIELTKEQEDILYSPVDEKDIEIRPDGLIFLPWMEYVTRLKKAFGMSWSIIPQGLPKPLGNFIYWPFWLIIHGKIAGFAIGEQEYSPNNPRMTYGDATEGAKSNALMRLCKGVGISLELWKPSFVREWKEKYAESYEKYNERKGKKETLWRKKGNGEQKVEEASESQGKEDVSLPHSPPFEPTTINEVTKKEGETKGKLWTLYNVHGANGYSYTTFDKKIGELADEFKKNQRQCTIIYEETQRGKSIKEIVEQK